MSDATLIQEQQSAPDFTLPAVGSSDIVKNGQVHLSDLKGKTVVLYFYQKTTRRAVQPKRALSVMQTMKCRNVELLYSE